MSDDLQRAPCTQGRDELSDAVPHDRAPWRREVRRRPTPQKEIKDKYRTRRG